MTAGRPARTSAVPGLRGLVTRIDRFVRNRVAEGIGDLLPRLDEVDERIHGLVVRADGLDRSRHEDRLAADATAARVEELAAMAALLDRLKFDVERVTPVIAALEVRTEQLRRQVAEQVPGAPSADTAAVAERELLASVRREHEQVRARLSAIAAYEERLRRLEEHASEAALPGQG